MNNVFKYRLSSDGYPCEYGYHGVKNGVTLTGAEPFEGFDIVNWRKVGDEWVDEKDGYKYFLIPSDIVPQIAHYAGFVKEAMFHKAFNVKVNEIETIVEGQTVMSPLFINYIPCSCTHWTDEGLMLLEAVVENWNSSNDLKKMVEPYKFESYAELEAFIQAQI